MEILDSQDKSPKPSAAMHNILMRMQVIGAQMQASDQVMQDVSRWVQDFDPSDQNNNGDLGLG
jgi:hypothetical protein